VPIVVLPPAIPFTDQFSVVSRALLMAEGNCIGVPSLTVAEGGPMMTDIGARIVTVCSCPASTAPGSGLCTY
jgi:hypothetical protein